MPKQGIKRKAEGPAPPPSKLRKTMAEEEFDDMMDWESDENELGSGKLGGKRKRGVYEEGEVMSETQQLLEMVKFGNKDKREAAREAHEYLTRVENKLRECQLKMDRRLEEERAKFARKDTEFINNIKAAYAMSNPFTHQGTGKELGGFAALYERNKDLTASARSLTETFDDVAQRVREFEPTELTKNNWEEEDEAMARLLAIGKKVGVDKYQSVMTASKKRRLGDEEAHAEKLLYDREYTESSGWGKVAKKQERAARKLAKASEMHRG